MSPDQALATLMALLSPEPNPDFAQLHQGGVDSRYPVTIEECFRPLPWYDIEGATMICSRVEMPESHTAPDGKSVSIAFAIAKSTSEAPAKDPVIYLHGGPGGHVVQDLINQEPVFNFLCGRRDVIFFDQRGAGLSDTAVACYQGITNDILDFSKPLDLTASPDTPVSKCVAEMQASDVSIENYNTTQSAYDVAALGYESFNIFGISYGTKLAQEVMRVAPENLRSTVIDSVSRLDNPAYDTNGVSADQALGWVVDFCAEDEACNTAYPDLEATIQTATERMASDPPMLGDKPVDGHFINFILNQNNKARREYTAYLPQMFTELAVGETAMAAQLFNTPLLPPQQGAWDQLLPKQSLLAPKDHLPALMAAREIDVMADLSVTTEFALKTISANKAATAHTNVEPILDAALSTAIKGMYPKDALSMMQTFLRTTHASGSREAIRDLVTGFVPSDDPDRILALIDALTDVDVKAFYRRAQIEATEITSSARCQVSMAIIACLEDFPFNSPEGYDKVASQYRFPIIDVNMRQEIAPLYEFCTLFEPQPREGFHEPVATDLPVLAMAGTKDAQTDPDAAEMVVRTFANGQALTFPEAGHGTIMHSQCARDIALGFIEAPMEPVNTACVPGLKPKFYIPSQ